MNPETAKIVKVIADNLFSLLQEVANLVEKSSAPSVTPGTINPNTQIPGAQMPGFLPGLPNPAVAPGAQAIPNQAQAQIPPTAIPNQAQAQIPPTAIPNQAALAPQVTIETLRVDMGKLLNLNTSFFGNALKQLFTGKYMVNSITELSPERYPELSADLNTILQQYQASNLNQGV